MDSKQLFAAMETDLTLSLRAFNAAAADLVEATFIIAASKIANLLRSITRSRPLYEFFAADIESYNFVEEFRAHQTQDEHGATYIALPEDKREMLRFVFCLLYAVDSNKIDLANLLHKCYHAIDANAEFAKFCNAIVKPFVLGVNEFLGTAPVANPTEDRRGTERPEPMPAEEALDDPLLDELRDIASEIIGAVAGDRDLDIAWREELMLACDGLIQALNFGERKSIRLMFIAVKNSIYACPSYEALKEVCERLTESTERYLNK